MSRPRLDKAERMAAIAAHIFNITGTSREIPDAVSAKDTNRPMIDVCPLVSGLQKCVAAVTGKLAIPITVRHHMYTVTEEATEIAHLLVEERRPLIGIFSRLEQQGMTTLHAHILVMTVALNEFLIGVVPQKTGQRVSDVRQRTVLAEIRPAAPASALEKCFRLKSVVVDLVTPDSTPELSHVVLLAPSHKTCAKAMGFGSRSFHFST